MIASIAVASIGLFAGCYSGPIPSPEEGDGQDVLEDTSGPERPDTGTTSDTSDGDNPKQDSGDETVKQDTGTDKQDTGDNTMNPVGFPDQITTDGGASFTANLDAGERKKVDLLANQGDFIVARVQTDDGSPGLYLFRPQDDGSLNRIAYDEADGPIAHIPYQDDRLSDGWEFYQGGDHVLEFRNAGNSSFELDFELICKSGPCTSGGGNQGGGDSDGVPVSEDNCPNTDNPGQANQDGDVFGDACDPNPSQITCPSATGNDLEQMIRRAYRDHQTQSYDDARQDLYGTVANDNGSVETIYIGRTIQTNGIPDPSEVNTEHVVPRSTISSRGAAFSDLHHLYPADSDANSRRSNYSFDNVVSATWSSNGSKLGTNSSGYTVFEPRDSEKGAAARAVFYFATVYDREISITKGDNGRGDGFANESTLRNWHNQVDPVSSEDEARNDSVYQFQQTRNPFVDCPGLVSQISDF